MTKKHADQVWGTIAIIRFALEKALRFEMLSMRSVYQSPQPGTDDLLQQPGDHIRLVIDIELPRNQEGISQLGAKTGRMPVEVIPWRQRL